MTLQTQKLAMVGLGIMCDSPPNRIQPPLVDGIHLRWAFKREEGFPWYGYYLFRRWHRGGIPLHLSQFTSNVPIGPWQSSTLSIPLGQFSSDRELLLTDDFPPAGSAEFDLEGRRSLRFVAPYGEPVRRVDVRMGFRSSATIQVTALLGYVPVVQVTAVGGAGDIVIASLEFDAITAVEVGPGAATLIELSVVPVSQDANQGWELVPSFPYPMCMPVTHPDYPCSGNAPVDRAAAEGLALSRVLYGPSTGLGGPPFGDLHEGLVNLVTGGPSAKKMADRWSSVAAAVPLPGLKIPRMRKQYPLDLVLLGALQPAIAQMIGLYWADQSAEFGRAYDYLILADHTDKLGGDPNSALEWLQETGFRDVDGYIVFNKKMAPAPPLHAPHDVRVYALPGGAIRKVDSDLQDASNNAGLRWDRGTSAVGAQQVLLPDRPIMYHLWRTKRSAAEPANPPDLEQYDLLTEQRKRPPGTTAEVA